MEGTLLDKTQYTIGLRKETRSYRNTVCGLEYAWFPEKEERWNTLKGFRQKRLCESSCSTVNSKDQEESIVSRQWGKMLLLVIVTVSQQKPVCLNALNHQNILEIPSFIVSKFRAVCQDF